MKETTTGGTWQIDREMGKIRDELGWARRQLRDPRLAQQVDVVRLVLPNLAKYGVGVTTCLVARENVVVDGPDENHTMMAVMAGVTFTHLASGQKVEDAYNGCALDVGSYATHEAFLNAIENAFREQFLQ
uniref:Uncharacterized protein n=1 Tax=Geobacter metallireducens TaxID=28232 RepID=A0A831UES7_GEOME